MRTRELIWVQRRVSRGFFLSSEFPGGVSGRFPRRFGRQDADESDPSAVLRHPPLR